MTILAPPPKFGVTFVNANGETRPGVGYKLYTYLAGSSTPKDTYHDITLGSPNQNPVVMDSRGECDLWLNGSYKFILKTDLDSTVWEVDEVRDPFTGQTLNNTTLTGTLTISSTSVTWSGNPTHSGNHIFSGNVTINGNTAIGNASGDTLVIAPNAVTWSNDPTHTGNHTWSGTNQTIVGVLQVESNLIIGGTLTIPGGEVFADVYTPTFTLSTNAAAASASIPFNWMRVRNMILVSGSLFVDPTAGSTLTQVEISFPIASNLTDSEQCCGNAARVATVAPLAGYITGEPTNNRAMLEFLNDTDVASRRWTIQFMYPLL